MASLGLQFSCHNYGDSDRQEVAVWEWTNKPSAGGYWLVYIHGGAWRSKDQTWGDFSSSVKIMADDKFRGRSAIRGFASLDYRLSGANEQPRPVQHPEHVEDIASGLALLAEKHGLNDDNYVLIGQSAGATLAFQLIMGQGKAAAPEAPLPAAILGVSGLYDLVGIDNRFKGTYAGFITPAFGPDKDAWKKASPGTYEGKFAERWPKRKAVMLGNSQTDSLVDMAEMDTMVKRLRSEGIEVDERKDWDGEHDFIWQDAKHITSALSDLLAKLPTVA